jgi:hypothetical protein
MKLLDHIELLNVILFIENHERSFIFKQNMEVRVAFPHTVSIRV